MRVMYHLNRTYELHSMREPSEVLPDTDLEALLDGSNSAKGKEEAAGSF